MNYLEQHRFEQDERWDDPHARASRSESLQVHPVDVLEEFRVLLEEYAPTWYTEKLRHRLLAAQRLPTDVLVEVCALLEDHAPAWYTEEQQARTLDSLQALGLLDFDDVEVDRRICSTAMQYCSYRK